MDPSPGSRPSARREDREARPSPQAQRQALVIALCDEVAHWSAAVRLREQLIDEDMSPRELADASIAIGDLAARIQAGLQLVRPLLLGQSARPEPNDPKALASAINAQLREYGRRGVDFDVGVERDLPSIYCDASHVQALACTLIYDALEAARPNGHVRLHVRSGDGVGFEISDDGSEEDAPLSWRDAELRGRTALIAAAHQMLTDMGGQLDVARRDEATRVTLRFPASDPSVPNAKLG